MSTRVTLHLTLSPPPSVLYNSSGKGSPFSCGAVAAALLAAVALRACSLYLV